MPPGKDFHCLTSVLLVLSYGTKIAIYPAGKALLYSIKLTAQSVPMAWSRA